MALFNFGKKKPDGNESPTGSNKPVSPSGMSGKLKPSGNASGAEQGKPKSTMGIRPGLPSKPPAGSGTPSQSAKLRPPMSGMPGKTPPPKVTPASAIQPPAPAMESQGSATDDRRRVRTSPKGKQLGALLLKAKSITEEQLEKALSVQQSEGGLLGQILVRLELCSKADIGSALKKQLTITTVRLEKAEMDIDAIHLLPRSFCEKNRLIPFEKIGGQLCVAMSNVLDAQAKHDIRERTQLQAKTFDAAWQDIQSAIEKYLPPEAPAESAASTTAAVAPEPDIQIELPEEIGVSISIEPPVPDEPSGVPPTLDIPVVMIEDEDPLPVAGEGDFADIELLPDIEVISLDQIPETPISVTAETEPLPYGKFHPIPISKDYFSAVIRGKQVQAEHRWLMEHLPDKPVPMEPAWALYRS